jgi:hypothetical protein
MKRMQGFSRLRSSYARACTHSPTLMRELNQKTFSFESTPMRPTALGGDAGIGYARSDQNCSLNPPANSSTI